MRSVFSPLLRSLWMLLWAGIAAAESPDAIDDVVRQYMHASQIPGVAVAIVDGGRIETLRSYGKANLDLDVAVTPDTAFQSASVSKIVTGVVLMRLVERGVVALDDPVSRHLGDTPARWDGMTLRHLVTHTSGVEDGWDIAPDASPLDVARLAMARPLAHAPGERSRYGLVDFIVLAAALERASGLDWPSLVEREVAQPLGLVRTGYSMQRDARQVRIGRIVPGRASTYAYRDGQQGEELYMYPMHAYAAGGLFTSARDLATLFVALSGNDFLQPAHSALLMRPMRLNDGSEGDFGIAWTTGRYRGELAVGHSGGPGLADVLHLPERGLTVIVLCNQRRFYPLLAKSIADLRVPEPPMRAAIQDTRPQRTLQLRTLLTAAVAAAPDVARFEPARGEGARAYLADFGQALLVAVGPIRAIAVLSERALEDGALQRTYRIDFERRRSVWQVTTDAKGRVRDLFPDIGDG